MKKYLAIVVMICLSAALLMGCGVSGTGDKSAGEQSGKEAQVETQQQAKSQDDSGQQAIKILEDKGVTFTNIKQTDEIAQTLLTVGLPTTYFVDSEGSRIN